MALGAGPAQVGPLLAMVNDWQAFLSSATSEKELQDLRDHARTGRPLGDATFVERLEKLAGRVLHPRKPGRRPSLPKQLKQVLCPRIVEKKHRQEVVAAMDNLDTYFVSLQQGAKPMQMVKHGFVHNEQMGVHAIDQSPLGKGAKTLRLYVYPDEEASILHVITLGGKNQQPDDVNECCKYVKALRKDSRE